MPQKVIFDSAGGETGNLDIEERRKGEDPQLGYLLSWLE